MCYGISKAEEVIYLRLSIPVLTKKKKKVKYIQSAATQ